jgi:dihydroorotase
MKLVIKGATIIDRNSPHHGKVRDVRIDRGKIDFSKAGSADKVIDAKGMFLTPGWVDMWCWMADPGFEHKESLFTGTAAAAAGGFTHVTVLPNNKPVSQTKNDITYVRNGSTSLVELLPIGAVTLETKGTDLTEMIDLHHAGAVAFSDGIEPIWHGDIMLKSLQYLQKFNGLLINRPEDRHLTQFGTMHEGIQSTMLGMKGMPSLAESLMISRDLDLLKYTGGKVHFATVSTQEGLSLIRGAKRAGLEVTCDMAAYQTAYLDTDLAEFDTNLKVNPPFRSNADRRALIRGLKDDTIDVITSGHIPQDEECKKLEFDLADFGVIGLQIVAPMISSLAEDIPVEQLLDKVSVRPREILQLNPSVIAEGETADLTLFDPSRTWELNAATSKSASRNSPFWQKELKGRTIAVIKGGAAALTD